MLGIVVVGDSFTLSRFSRLGCRRISVLPVRALPIALPIGQFSSGVGFLAHCDLGFIDHRDYVRATTTVLLIVDLSYFTFIVSAREDGLQAERVNAERA